MTLSIAWVRTAGGSKELVLASDSRLRFGCNWDSCQKIFLLPRDDCAICFAGDTQYAYPLMHAMESAIRHFPKSMNRQQELSDLEGHAIRVFNSMLANIGDLPIGQERVDEPEAYFLFGGFCWKQKAFRLWTLHFDPNISAFTFRPTSCWDGVDGHKQIAFIGDYVEDTSIAMNSRVYSSTTVSIRTDRPSCVRPCTKSYAHTSSLRSGRSRTQLPSLSHRRPRLGSFFGTFSASRRQMRSTRL